jgi:hypothetical protein
VAVPMLACTVTTGGHHGVSAMVSEGRAAGGFRRERSVQGSPLASCASSAEREGRGLVSLCVLPKERGDGRGGLGR